MGWGGRSPYSCFPLILQLKWETFHPNFYLREIMRHLLFCLTVFPYGKIHSELSEKRMFKIFIKHKYIRKDLKIITLRFFKNPATLWHQTETICFSHKILCPKTFVFSDFTKKFMKRINKSELNLDIKFKRTFLSLADKTYRVTFAN